MAEANDHCETTLSVPAVVVASRTIDADEQFMLQALSWAEEALTAGEVPVGCVFVVDAPPFAEDRQPTVVAVGRNEVNESRNAIRHAEMVAIDRILARCKSSDVKPSSVFSAVTVYVAVEPCIMCASALYELGVKRIVFGCSNDRFGGINSVVDVGAQFYPSTVVECRQGLLSAKAVQLLKRFYKQENLNAPEEVRKCKTGR